MIAEVLGGDAKYPQLFAPRGRRRVGTVVPAIALKIYLMHFFVPHGQISWGGDHKLKSSSFYGRSPGKMAGEAVCVDALCGTHVIPPDTGEMSGLSTHFNYSEDRWN